MQAMVEERAEEVRTEKPQVHRQTDRQTDRDRQIETDSQVCRPWWRRGLRRSEQRNPSYTVRQTDR
jgi:hypothetical protein